jgi:hypothetical protein
MIALISGALSGIGAVARDAALLGALDAELRQAHDIEVDVLVADLTDDATSTIGSQWRTGRHRSDRGQTSTSTQSTPMSPFPSAVFRNRSSAFRSS